jgi:hypothetical protein
VPPRLPSGKVGLLPESRRETKTAVSYRLSDVMRERTCPPLPAAAHANFRACGMHHRLGQQRHEIHLHHLRRRRRRWRGRWVGKQHGGACSHRAYLCCLGALCISQAKGFRRAQVSGGLFSGLTAAFCPCSLCVVRRLPVGGEGFWERREELEKGKLHPWMLRRPKRGRPMAGVTLYLLDSSGGHFRCILDDVHSCSRRRHLMQ